MDDNLRNSLEFCLVINTDYTYWEKRDKYKPSNMHNVNNAIAHVFEPMYSQHEDWTDFLDDSIVLLQSCVWTGVNVPFPEDPEKHMYRVVDNVMNVYYTWIHDGLETTDVV